MEKTPLVFIETPRVLLVGLEPHHARELASFYNTPVARTLLSATDFATEDIELSFIARSMTNTDKIFGLVDREKGTLFGTLGLHKINLIHGTATTGANIGLPEYRDKGYGTEAKMYLLHYAFRTLGLRKIHSRAHANNPRSIAYSKKCGYKEVGVLKEEVYRDGKYEDMVLLSVWREDWESAFNAWKSKYL